MTTNQYTPTPGCMCTDCREVGSRHAVHVSAPAAPEPPPTPRPGAPSMHDLVCADLQERKEFGLRKYGTLLQMGNGRNHVMDAYQEVLDLAVYFKQVMLERDALASALSSAERREQEARELLKRVASVPLVKQPPAALLSPVDRQLFDRDIPAFLRGDP